MKTVLLRPMTLMTPFLLSLGTALPFINRRLSTIRSIQNILVEEVNIPIECRPLFSLDPLTDLFADDDPFANCHFVREDTVTLSLAHAQAIDYWSFKLGKDAMDLSQTFLDLVHVQETARFIQHQLQGKGFVVQSATGKRIVRRRVLKTRKVPRKTKLSNISDYEQDLDDEFFTNLLDEVRLPTFQFEEYSDYEDVELDSDDEEEYAEEIIELAHSPLSYTYPKSWLDDDGIELPNKWYLLDLPSSQLSFKESSTRHVGEKLLFSSVAMTRKPTIGFIFVDVPQCSIEELYSNEIESVARQRSDRWRLRRQAGGDFGLPIVGFLHIDAKRCSLEDLQQVPMDRIYRRRVFSRLSIHALLDLGSPFCAVDDLKTVPLDNVYQRRSHHNLEKSTRTTPRKTMLSQLSDLDFDLDESTFDELVDDLQSDPFALDEGDVVDSVRATVAVNLNGVVMPRHTTEGEDWDTLNDRDALLLHQYMALRSVAVDEEDWDEFDDSDLEPLLRRDESHEWAWEESRVNVEADRSRSRYELDDWSEESTHSTSFSSLSRAEDHGHGKQTKEVLVDVHYESREYHFEDEVDRPEQKEVLRGASPDDHVPMFKGSGADIDPGQSVGDKGDSSWRDPFEEIFLDVDEDLSSFQEAKGILEEDVTPKPEDRWQSESDHCDSFAGAFSGDEDVKLESKSLGGSRDTSLISVKSKRNSQLENRDNESLRGAHAMKQHAALPTNRHGRLKRRHPAIKLTPLHEYSDEHDSLDAQDIAVLRAGCDWDVGSCLDDMTPNNLDETERLWHGYSDPEEDDELTFAEMVLLFESSTEGD